MLTQNPASNAIYRLWGQRAHVTFRGPHQLVHQKSITFALAIRQHFWVEGGSAPLWDLKRT